jgi:hypothetical protein
MTDSMKYLWLLFREDSSYIFMLMLIVGSAVIVSAFFQRAITSRWGKTLSVILCMVVSMITTATGVLDPESTYKQIINRKENIIYTLKNCRISAFEAQQAGFLAKAKDGWSCPDGVTRYMDVRYRDKAEVNKLSTEGK